MATQKTNTKSTQKKESVKEDTSKKQKKKVSKSKKTNGEVKSRGNGRYNWVHIKQQFLASNYMSVDGFMREVYGLEVNKSNRKNIKGWGEEKKAIQEKLKDEMASQFKENLKKEWREVFDKMEMAHVKGLHDIAKMILDQGTVKVELRETWGKDEDGNRTSKIEAIERLQPYLTHGDITAILKHIKLEKGEPTDLPVQSGSVAREWLRELKEKKTQSKNQKSS